MLWLAWKMPPPVALPMVLLEDRTVMVYMLSSSPTMTLVLPVTLPMLPPPYTLPRTWLVPYRLTRVSPVMTAVPPRPPPKMFPFTSPFHDVTLKVLPAET